MASRKKKKTFFVGGNNGVSLIADPLKERGWVQMDDEKATNFTLKWVEVRRQIDFAAFRPGKQLLARNPKISVLASKAKLIDTLRTHERLARSRADKKSLALCDFFPVSFKVDDRKCVLGHMIGLFLQSMSQHKFT